MPGEPLSGSFSSVLNGAFATRNPGLFTSYTIAHAERCYAFTTRLLPRPQVVVCVCLPAFVAVSIVSAVVYLHKNSISSTLWNQKRAGSSVHLVA